MVATLTSRLEQVYVTLLDCHGPQHWWPGDSPFEIMVGAILTQNTSWANVEKAIDRLVNEDCLEPEAILACEDDRLADMLRPSGYFNIKSRRLKSFCRWYLDAGAYEALSTWSTNDLRRGLLAVHGIGPETADDILLYAFERPVFVIDAYTRRLFSRLGMIKEGLGYEALREIFEMALGPQVPVFNEYHALIVIHGKDLCRPKPRCSNCCLKPDCQQGNLAGTDGH
jgi:endonuclease-3 related protein